jgi:hypothetical protein
MNNINKLADYPLAAFGDIKRSPKRSLVSGVSLILGYSILQNPRKLG